MPRDTRDLSPGTYVMNPDTSPSAGTGKPWISAAVSRDWLGLTVARTPQQAAGARWTTRMTGAPAGAQDGPGPRASGLRSNSTTTPVSQLVEDAGVGGRRGAIRDQRECSVPLLTLALHRLDALSCDSTRPLVSPRRLRALEGADEQRDRISSHEGAARPKTARPKAWWLRLRIRSRYRNDLYSQRLCARATPFSS